MTHHSNTFSTTVASRVLALALSELLPNSQILDVGLSYHGIYCDFFYPAQLYQEQFSLQIEEHLRQIAREKREILLMEMVPFSAGELLRSIHQEARAKQVFESSGLVSILRIGECFADPVEEECRPGDTGRFSCFRIQELRSLGKHRWRLFALAAESKKAMKPLIESWKLFPQKNHEVIGKKENLWTYLPEQKRVWLPKGVALMREWISIWRSLFTPLAGEIEGAKGEWDWSLQKSATFMEFFRPVQETLASERGLLDTREPLMLQINSFIDAPASAISFLQTIDQSLTILGFNYVISLQGSRERLGPLGKAIQDLNLEAQENHNKEGETIQFLVSDFLGRKWIFAEASDMSIRGCRGISLRVWIERNFALLLERSGENCLAEAQVVALKQFASR